MIRRFCGIGLSGSCRVSRAVIVHSISSLGCRAAGSAMGPPGKLWMLPIKTWGVMGGGEGGRVVSIEWDVREVQMQWMTLLVLV